MGQRTINSDQSVNVLYAAPPPSLDADTTGKCASGIRKGQSSAYSQPSWWEMGLLSPPGLESAMDHARQAARTRGL